MEAHVHYDPEKIDPVSSIPFIAVHVGALVGVVYVGVTPALVAWAVAAYVIRMWGITAGYHRYFSHRSFKSSRVFQFVMAFIGTCSIQKGVLWWAAHHRHHHRHSDEEPDIHSPTLKGFVWAHLGWILCHKYDEYDPEKIRDFTKYPELVWITRYHLVPPLAVGALVWAVFGLDVFVWAGLVSTVALWHGTFTINSLCHMIGRQRFPTRDESRNSLVLALITLGEGWHNNHHFYPGSSRQGFYWWEVDLVWYSLKVLSWLGIVWDLNGVPERVLEKGRQADAELATARSG